jgi:hypothetical protein
LDSSPTANTVPSLTSLQLLQLPASSATKQRDKLETISERIETQESQLSQITSVNQTPPFQQPPKASKWKWMKTGSTEPPSATVSTTVLSNVKPAAQSNNPFDPNLSDEESQLKIIGVNERKPSIPLSLFIPRSFRRGSDKTPEEGGDDRVSQ